MALVNIHFLNLQANYLFADIAKKVNAFKVMHPKADVISLGIGDVTQPLCPAVVEAMHKAVDEMATADGFRGYGPEQGYDFLREAILKNDFAPRGVRLSLDEVFINDGAKSDTGNFQELLHWDNFIGVTDPIYPVYIDSNVMIGRCGTYRDGRWTNVRYMPTTAENGFIPDLPKGRPVDVIYLCFPNNPTGTVITKQELRRWVNYALKNDALILFDAAYQAYIRDPEIPHSIYEIRGARKCAVEFRSFSKTAGFTGVRCGYTIVPKNVSVSTFEGERIPLNQLWLRRQCTKFNGTSYISQRAAKAIYSPEGKRQVRQTIDYYMQNAARMLTVLRNLGFECYGGENAPYIWMHTPDGTTSWQFFEALLYGANVVCTPGVGFGPSGEGYVRFTAFASHEQTEEALSRIAQWVGLPEWGHQHSVEHIDHVLGVAGIALRVGHHQHGGALLVQLGEQLHHLQSVLRVEVTRRLVGKNQLRVHHHSTGDGHALLLSAGELLGEVVGAMRDGHAAQHLLHALLPLFLRYTEIGQRQLHVFLHVQLVNQVEALEHKAYLTLAHSRALALLQRAHLLSVEPIPAGSGIVEQAQDVQQR